MIDYQDLSREQFERYCKERARQDIRSTTLPEHVAIVLGEVGIHVPDDDDGIARHLLEDGCWESWVSVAAGRRVQRLAHEPPPVGQPRRQPRVLNIGANVGYYACLFASLGAMVKAVEPQHRLACMLERTIAWNRWQDRMIVVRAAVGGPKDGAVLSVPGHRYMNATLLQGDRLASVAGTDSVETSVVSSIDLEAVGRGCDYVFCDAEGWEPMIFQPAEDWLRRERPIVTLEFSPHRYDHPEKFAAWWGDIGYDAYLVDYDGREIRQSAIDLTEERMITFIPR